MLSSFTKLSPELRGIVWMLSSCFWFSALAVLIRYLSKDMHPFTMVFYRNLFALAILLPVIIRAGRKVIYTAHFPWHGVRAVTGVIGMLLFFSALAKIPINQAIALSFTVPLFTTAGAIVFLKEKVSWQRWLALIIGFMGTLVILRPGMEVFDPAMLLVVAATCAWSTSNILIKKMTRTEYPETMMFYMTLLAIPLSLPFALLHWTVPDTEMALGLVALGITSNLGQFCLFRAYTVTEVSYVLPIDFSRLIFVSIFSYFCFNEVLDVWAALGAVIILASTVYTTRKGRTSAPVPLPLQGGDTVAVTAQNTPSKIL